MDFLNFDSIKVLQTLMGRFLKIQWEPFFVLQKNLGTHFFDNASSYDTSEEGLGRHGARHFSVITKLDAIPNDASGLSDWMYREVRESLKKLRTLSLPGLLIHR